MGISTIASAAAVLLASTLTTPSIADVLKNTERGVTVKYSDGFTEKYEVVYNGVVNVAKEERGGPAKPLDGKFVDDRQCYWSIQTFVERQIYAVNRQGQRAILEQFNKRFQTSFANQGSDFKLLQLRSENCGDAQNRFSSDVANANKAIADVFDSTISSDLGTLKNVFNQATTIEVSAK